MAEQPPQEQENPYLPPGTPLVFDTFIGIDTSSSRPGIADEAMAWCDGFMPLGKNNLRTLYGVGTPLYTATGTKQIVYFSFANLGASPICIVFLSDGSIDQVNTNTGVVTHIGGAGTIHNPSRTNVGLSQWGSQYILIVANQQNGYFIWDGTALYSSGTISPIVNVTNSGKNYTSQPKITISGGSGSGATFTAQLGGGAIENIFIVHPGSGYVVGDTPILTITGGGSDDSASATAAVITGGGIQSINVSAIGAQYGAGSYVTLTGGGGHGAIVQGQFSNGQCLGVTILDPGQGYTSAPTVDIFDPTSTGFAFAATAVIATGQIGSVTITGGGSGYVTAPSATILGDGTGAQLQAVIGSGMVTAVNVTNPGLGYTKAQVVFTGGNDAASATIDIMPFGVKGNAIETYQSRAWIVDGALLQFSAPESLGDFSTSGGGGFAQSTDSFLRVKYIQPIQTNGFLYLIADSSINYISGVQTSGTPPTTTYTNQNADPEIGTPYAAAIDVFSRNIVFGNPFGVHVSYGGAVSKISRPLDGIYNSVPNFGGFEPSAAKAIIFGKKVWMILIPVIDPISGDQVNKLFMWNGEQWWSSQQNMDLIYIAHQEINSVINAWGTDGSQIRQLFARPTTQFTKTVQSKLWAAPGGYSVTKTATRLAGLAYYYNPNGGQLTVTVDNEDAPSDPYTIDGTPGVINWKNNSNNLVSWQNGSHATVSWSTGSGTGVFVINPIAVAQNGALTGLTVTTSAADMALISMTVTDEIWGHRQ